MARPSAQQSRPHSLPVLMPRVPGQRWSCQSCTRCCRELVVHLFDEDRRKIDRQNWTAELGDQPYVRLGRAWVLNKRDDGACVFLDPDGLCRIHRKFGAEAKPFACRLYPFSIRPVDGNWQTSLRFDCPTLPLRRSPARPIEGMFRDLTARSPDDLPLHEPGVIDLKRGLRAHNQELHSLERRLGRWFARDDLPLIKRVAGAAQLTAALSDASLAKIRGERFEELLGLLFEALPVELQAEHPPPSPRQHGMLRQLAFVHAEHVAQADMLKGRIFRLQRRWRQLRAARSLRKGAGPVPALGGLESSVTYTEVEAVTANATDHERIEDLIGRYIAARLSGRAVFGTGYYGWPVLDGLAALWAGIPVAGWLARYHAACADRHTLSFDDVAWGIGAVDRAATRLPALGTLAERARLVYLRRDDGLARLIDAYWPTEN